MKKSTFQKLMLMLLPIGAVGLAITPDSVRYFDTQSGMHTYSSYFAVVDVGTLQMAAPLAAVLSLVTGILSAVYLGRKSAGCLKAAAWTAFLASVFATLPVLMRGAVVVTPNVMLPIMMLVEAFLANVMVKKPAKDEATAPRLSRH